MSWCCSSCRCRYLQLLLLALLLTTTPVVRAIQSAKSQYKFAVIGKLKGNIFFDVVKNGCEAQARALTLRHSGHINVTCEFYGTEVDDAQEQAQIIQGLIEQTASNISIIDGISLSVMDEKVANASIQQAMDAGIPVVTFDSDAPDSSRLAYIGSDNYKFGVELGKLLHQLRPLGGNYGILHADAPNVVLRANGARDRLRHSPWSEVSDSPKSCDDSTDKALDVMWEFAANPAITAIVSVGGWPMFDEKGWLDFVQANPRLTLIVGDSLPIQLKLIQYGKVHALVGQRPYSMGEMSIDILFRISQESSFDPGKNGSGGKQVIYGTEFLEVLRYPLNLPPVHVNRNYLGNLAYLGYFYFAVICMTSVSLMFWIFYFRKDRVVVASQPPFLYMICVGSLIMGSTIIPLTFDDEKYDQQANDFACMSIPWLFSIGFTTAFAALFSKLRRVNRIFRNPSRFSRVKVEAKDVLLPYTLLLGANLLLLITWTVVSPLKYVRHNAKGTDEWNRVIATYGQCESSSDVAKPQAFQFCLASINFAVLLVANYQAYEARTVVTEFSESRYIGLIMSSILQAFVFGVPIMFLIKGQPRADFVVISTILFLTCIVVLILMFYPKILYLKHMKEQRSQIQIAEQTHSEQEGGLRVKVYKLSESVSKHQHREKQKRTTTKSFKAASTAANHSNHNMSSLPSVSKSNKKSDFCLASSDNAGGSLETDKVLIQRDDVVFQDMEAASEDEIDESVSSQSVDSDSNKMQRKNVVRVTFRDMKQSSPNSYNGDGIGE